MSERLNLDTSSLKPHFGRPNLFVLQIASADFGHARELVIARAGDNVYPGHGASDPLSVLIESKRDIGGIKLPIADPLPGTMPATEYRMRIPASKESTIRRKGKQVLSHTSRTTGCHNPRPNQTSIGFDGNVLAGGRRRRATGNDQDS
jgi:hypothetical protein